MKSNYIKLLSTFLLLVIVFSYTSSVFAVTTFDNFDSYSAGSALNGQGSWSGDASPQVVNSPTQSGANSASLSNSNSGDVSKTISPALTVNGSIFSSYMQASNANNGGGGSMNLKFYSGATLLFTTRLSQDTNSFILDGVTTGQTIQGGLSDSTWYQVEIEFNFTAKTARARVNGGTWTSSMAAVGSASFSQIDKVAIQYGAILGTMSMDTLTYTVPASTPASTVIKRGSLVSIIRGIITTIRH